jgi:hypothetical protein
LANLVFSYSHVDEELRNKLEVHLAGLKRLGLINTWHDRRILAGQEFAHEIDHHFETADVVLLLVSPDFIASDYCYNLEMTRALERHEHKEAIVIPIILRPCDWHDLPFGKLQAATLDGKPIVHFPTQDDGFLQVVQAIKKSIRQLTPLESSPQNSLQPSIEETFINNPAPVQADRSSNLRIKKTFTDRERDQARVDVFEYVSGYFENSLQELTKRNDGIETEFRRLDANSFEASIYVQGKRKCKCGIWIGNSAMGGDVFFSHAGVSRNSYNESMNLSDDGYSLGFKPLGMVFRGGGENQLLSNEGVAEYFWELLISPLQN